MSKLPYGNVKSTESKFVWEIPNFSAIKSGVGDFIYSPTFTMVHHSNKPSRKLVNSHWRLLLFPSGGYAGNKVSDGEYLSICLENVDSFAVSAAFKIGFMGELGAHHFDKDSTGNWNFGKRQASGWSNFVKKEAILNDKSLRVVDDTVGIFCSISSVSVISNELESEEEDCSEILLNHFDMLFHTGKFSDVKIRIGNQELCVHKSIVASLSPVFQAMFENQMKEHNENVVEVKDIEFNIMKEMLRFMYARKVNGIEKIAGDLFVAADKYCVKGLKRLCEKCLCKELNEVNALQSLEMAVQYSMKTLKQNAVKYIVRHLKSFNAREDFKELSSECKNELFIFIAEKIDKIELD